MIVSRSPKKLALRRESLRNLSAEELGQAHGGAYYLYAQNLQVYNNTIEWVILKQPAPSTSRTDSGYFNYYNYYW